MTHAEYLACADSARASASTARRAANDDARPSSASAAGPPSVDASASAPAVTSTPNPGRSRARCAGGRRRTTRRGEPSPRPGRSRARAVRHPGRCPKASRESSPPRAECRADVLERAGHRRGDEPLPPVPRTRNATGPPASTATAAAMPAAGARPKPIIVAVAAASSHISTAALRGEGRRGAVERGARAAGARHPATPNPAPPTGGDPPPRAGGPGERARTSRRYRLPRRRWFAAAPRLPDIVAGTACGPGRPVDHDHPAGTAFEQRTHAERTRSVRGGDLGDGGNRAHAVRAAHHLHDRVDRRRQLGPHRGERERDAGEEHERLEPGHRVALENSRARWRANRRGRC